MQSESLFCYRPIITPGMSDNPYQTPPIPFEIKSSRPVARSTFGRKLWLLLGLVVAPAVALAAYILALRLLLLVDLAANDYGLIPFVYGLLTLALPILPAYHVLRWASHWLDAPDSWDSLASLITVGAAIGTLLYWFR